MHAYMYMCVCVFLSNGETQKAKTQEDFSK